MLNQQSIPMMPGTRISNNTDASTPSGNHMWFLKLSMPIVIITADFAALVGMALIKVNVHITSTLEGID